MNMHASGQRTLAENALVAGFEARMSDLPGDGPVATMRDKAIELVKSGLPTRRLEAWHYTDLRRLLRDVPDFGAAGDAQPLRPLVDGAPVLAVLNGRADRQPELPAGVTAHRLVDRLMDGNLSSSLAVQGADDAIGAINAAFASDGWVVDVAAGTDLDQPFELQTVQAGGQAHVRWHVTVRARARATIVERQGGNGSALATTVGHLSVGEGADVLWVVDQEQAETATNLAQLNATLGANSSLTLFFLNAGGKLVRQEVRVATAGEGAVFTMRGVNLLAGEGHTDVTMVLDHATPHTASTEIVRNVVTDRAHGVFQGRINVHQIAQKTDAKMACNTLLLSDDAEFSTKPELEIFADDVACGHGATVTEIDRSHLFYLMARGVDEKSARALLVKAFVAEVVEELSNEAIVEALEARLEAWFARHA
jgi:Fe-S cluster assembly protein SufD